MKYRPEIDGLRTIAVISVLIYHAQFALGGVAIFPGGYLGVDVFFVISGYLISTILLTDMLKGNFSYANFYERRARRILPILLLVMLCSCIAAWIYMMPKALNEFSGSLLSSLFFSSNVWFWLQDSYTAEASALSPLLHTWSLSIEEQFYLIFPALLLLVLRYGRQHLTKFIIICIALSFAAAQYSSTRFPDANFYLAHTRAWELLAGTLLAMLALSRQPFQHRFMTFLPVIGLLLILIPMVIYHDDWPHPSALTVIPIVGTMILIWYLPQPGLTQRLLSSRLFTSIGLISYSLYLWHFPIFAFARINNIGPLSTIDKFICLSLSFLLSIIGYFIIEKPMRNRSFINSKLFISIVAITITILIAFSVNVIKTDGASHRLGLIKTLFDGSWRKDSYIYQNGLRCDVREIDPKKLCYFKSPKPITASIEQPQTIINIGDSHAEVFAKQLLTLAEQRGWNYQQITKSGCPYVEGAYRYKNKPKLSRCDAEHMDLIKNILADSPPSIVVYIGRIPGYLSGKTFDNQEGGKSIKTEVTRLQTDPDGPYPTTKIDQLIPLTINNMLDMGHTVVIIYPIPEIGFGLPKMVKSQLQGVPHMPKDRIQNAFENMSITTSYGVYKERSKRTINIFDSIPDHQRLIRIRTAETFCSEASNRCYTHDKRVIYYFDDNHLSQHGTKLLVDEIAKHIPFK